MRVLTVHPQMLVIPRVFNRTRTGVAATGAGTRSGTWAGRTREAPLVLQQHLGYNRSSCSHSMIKLTVGMSY